MTDQDYSTWLTKAEAATAIGVRATKTIERLADAGKLQRASRPSRRGGANEVVYHPDDVARVAQARRQGPLAPFLVPVADAPANGRGRDGSAALALTPPAPLPGDDLLRAVFAAALRAVSETSQTPTLFVTIPEAAAVSGLSRACLRRLIAEGTLKARKDRGWKIRRTDLEAL